MDKESKLVSLEAVVKCPFGHENKLIAPDIQSHECCQDRYCYCERNAVLKFECDECAKTKGVFACHYELDI